MTPAVFCELRIGSVICYKATHQLVFCLFSKFGLQVFTRRAGEWGGVCPSEAEEDRQETMEQLSSYLVCLYSLCTCLEVMPENTCISHYQAYHTLHIPNHCAPCRWTKCAQHRLMLLSLLSCMHLLALQDIVETHLLRDIAARSENFFQAASVVQELRGVLARTYVQVKTLRQEVETRLLCIMFCILLHCDGVHYHMLTWSLSQSCVCLQTHLVMFLVCKLEYYSMPQQSQDWPDWWWTQSLFFCCTCINEPVLF